MQKKRFSPIRVIFLLFLSFSAISQPPSPNDLLLILPDNTGGTVIPHRLAATADGGFLSAGSDGVFGYITKTGSCGGERWTRQYLFGEETDLNSIIELPSGEIVAVGSCLKCAPGDTTKKALLIKTDASGLLLVDTTLGFLNYSAQANDVIRAANGKIAVTGWAVFATFLSPTDAFISVLNTDLQSDLFKTCNHFYADNSQALAQTADGGFVLAGYSSPALFAPNQARVFRTDSSGNLLWTFLSPNLNSQFNDIVQAADNRIIAFGDRLVDTVTGRDVYLSAMKDTDGALLSEKTFGSAGNDNGKSLETIDEGFLAGAVYGQASQANYSTRDWVFRLDQQLELQSEYFRDGYLFGHFPVNALPLSSNGQAFAFLSRLIFFSSTQIEFFKRTFPGIHTTLSQKVQHYQLAPRDLATNMGKVAFSGTVSNPAQYEAMQLEVLRNDVLQTTLTDMTLPEFDFEPEIPAELAEYTFRLSGIKDQQRYLEAEACEVVAGDAYLIQGQSNGVAGLPYDPDNTIEHAYRYHTTPFVRNFGLGAGPDSLLIWHKETGFYGDYTDNISGQWGLILGKNISDHFGVPVAIINGAISGISIDSMMPDPVHPYDPNTRYGAYLRRVEKSGLRDHLRGLLMFQGETNAAGGIWDSAQKYYNKFVTLDNFWKQDFPSVERRYFFQIRPGAYFAGATLLTCLQVEEAQRLIAENLPEWKIMSTTGMNHDGTHYYYPNGYERAGNDIYRLVARDLYGSQDTLNINPPSVEAIRFSNCNHREITLELRHTADQYTWTPGLEYDFLLEGSENTLVIAGQIVGNTVVLQLSEAPGSGFTGLSYTSHPKGDSASVKNANGIGMLTFFNIPLAPYQLEVQVNATPASSAGAMDGTATATASGGTPGYMFEWSNGDTGATADSLGVGVYSLTVTDAIGCTVIQQFQLLVGVSIPEWPIKASLSPNPCNAYLNLILPEINAVGGLRFAIRDINGKLILSPEPVHGTITHIKTALLPPGTYSIHLTDQQKLVWNGLFVKN